MNMTVYQRLTRPLLALSNAADYEDAKHEWRTTGEVWDGDYTLPDEHRTKHPGQCLCGKTIRWHFEIENTENGNIDIVGSDCIHHWMVLRHLTEVEGLDPSEVTEERIQEWIELNVNKLKKNAWFRMHGKMFEDIWKAVADIDLRVNVKVVNQYWDYVTERHEPKFILRRRARGKPGDKHYRMASIVWRWNHPDNPKNQQTKYGFPNDRLWVDMLMFNARLEEVINNIDNLEQSRATRIEQVEERKNLSAEMRDEIDDEEFANNCSYYGIEPFNVNQGKNSWEIKFLKDVRVVITDSSKELSNRQTDTLRKILMGSDRPATEKQKNYMKKLKIDIPDNLTVQEASRLIDANVNN
jgi:hypothetical protein